MSKSKILLILLIFAENIYTSTAYVTTTADSNDPGTLRWAVGLGIENVFFDIPGAGTRIIELNADLGPLPDMTTEGVNIDATTQPGYDGVPLVAVDGRNLGDGGVGFNVKASNCTITGLSIVKFGSAGINIVPDSGSIVNTNITYNYIGVYPTLVTGANQYGILMAGNVAGTNISNNIISKNQPYGVILLNGVQGSRILSNEISRNGNVGIGIDCQADTPCTNNYIYGNTIKLNGSYGIGSISATSSHNTLNSFINNSIYENQGVPAIALTQGENNNQQPPTITSATLSNDNSTITVTGRSPAAGAPLQIEFYVTDPAFNSSNPQGQTLIGTITSISPNTDFNEEYSAPMGTTKYSFLTTLATAKNNDLNPESFGDTSEFSPAVNFTRTNPLTITSFGANPTLVNLGESSTLSVTFINGTAPYTLRWSDGTSEQVNSAGTYTHTVRPIVSTQYCVRITSNNGDLVASPAVLVQVAQSTSSAFTQRLIAKYKRER